MIIAVDFDGTLIKEVPYGKLSDDISTYIPNKKLFDWLIARRSVGDKIVLWTCRENTSDRKLLDSAVEFCKTQGLTFDSINENCRDGHLKYEWYPRKIFADIYIDDRSLFTSFDEEFNWDDYHFLRFK
jgi:hypothetical protein